MTGATGFIGYHVAQALINTGWTVHALVRTSSKTDRLKPHHGTIVFHNWQEVIPDEWFEELPAIDALIHVATNYGRGSDTPSTLASTNTHKPLILLETAIANRVPVVINTDTCFTTDYKYLRPYTLSKKQFVQWGQILCDGSNATRFVNLELQHPYGPGDRISKFVPAMIQQCQTSTGTIDLTPGEQKKDFVYVKDVARVYPTVLESIDQIQTPFVNYQIGSGHAVSVREFVETIHRLTHSRAVLNFGGLNYRDGEIMFSQANLEAIRSLGWYPTTSLEDGLRETIIEDSK